MNNLSRDASNVFAILLAAMSGRALAQGPGRGGFGPSPEMQAAAKAQTESATSQMHAYLNDIVGLENPTIEMMSRWFWEKLKDQLPGLYEITLHETPRARCTYRGE